jgi:hypothetical protein
MRLTPPTNVIFMIALFLAALALLSLAVPIPVVGPNRFWFMTAAWASLTAGVFFKGI